MAATEFIIVGALAAAVGTCHVHAMFDGRSRLLGPRDRRLPPTNRATVALTFDDGPHPEITPRLLDLLDAHDARATFFLIGEHVARWPKVAEEIVRRGHTVGNHTMSHRHDGVLRGHAFWRREIVDAECAIADATGVRTRWFRPPLGHRNLRQSIAVAQLGYRTVLWSCRSLDAVDQDPARVLSRVASRIGRQRRPRDIILLHDGVDPRRTAPPPRTLEIVPALCARLRGDGIEITSLAKSLPRRPYAEDLE